MALTYKVLSQTKPSAATLTDSYTVPSVTSTVVSSIVATNQSATPTAIRVSIAVAGLADTPKQYIAYDMVIAANQAIAFVIGVTLGAADVIRVYNTLATVSFSVFGVERT